MTNREYLNTLSNEKFLEVINGWQRNCPVDDECYGCCGNDYFQLDCHFMKEWLNKEHKE